MAIIVITQHWLWLYTCTFLTQLRTFIQPSSECLPLGRAKCFWIHFIYYVWEVKYPHCILKSCISAGPVVLDIHSATERDGRNSKYKWTEINRVKDVIRYLLLILSKHATCKHTIMCQWKSCSWILWYSKKPWERNLRVMTWQFE